MRRFNFLLKRNRAEVVKKIESAEDALDENDLKTAQKSIEWLKLHQEILQFKQSKNKKIWALIIGITCVSIVSLLATLRVYDVNIKVLLTTGNISFKLTKQFILEDLDGSIKASRFAVINAQSVEGFPSKLPESHSSSFRVNLIGSDIELRKIEIDNGAEIEIEIENQRMRLFIREGVLETLFLVKDATIQFEKFENKIKVPPNDPPTFITIRTVISKVKPAYIQIDSLPGLNFKNIPVESIHFLKRDQGSKKFISSINSGQIVILQTNEEYNLSEDDYFILDFKKIKFLNLSLDKNSIKASFEAEVCSLKVGIEGFLDQLKPTLLNYLYYSQEILLLWSAVVFIAGVLWSIKNLS